MGLNVYMSTTKSEEGIGSLELELQVVVSHQVGTVNTLGTTLGSSVRAATTLKP